MHADFICHRLVGWLVFFLLLHSNEQAGMPSRPQEPVDSHKTAKRKKRTEQFHEQQISNYLNLKTELATWGGLGVGASFGSALAVLAHTSLSRPWQARLGGGGTGVDQKACKTVSCIHVCVTRSKEMSR